MELKGVHFLLTYKCDLQCDHCFVWGNPQARGTFTIAQVKNVLTEAKKLLTVDHVAIEGGEPFLFYPLVTKTVEEATKLGFRVEILSNCYWATCPEDALEWLSPLARFKNVELTLSSDLYHGENWESDLARNAVRAANQLEMKVGIIAVRCPNAGVPCPNEIEGVKVGPWEIMYKGRAAEKLTGEAIKKPWREFTKCPYEDFEKQKRVHIDPLGYVHVCQGISIGNAWQKPLSRIIEEYDVHQHPILEPLVHGGPTALVEKFGLPHDEVYADACHLCFSARLRLRSKFPDSLAPDQMYGEPE